MKLAKTLRLHTQHCDVGFRMTSVLDDANPDVTTYPDKVHIRVGNHVVIASIEETETLIRKLSNGLKRLRDQEQRVTNTRLGRKIAGAYLQAFGLSVHNQEPDSAPLLNRDFDQLAEKAEVTKEEIGSHREGIEEEARTIIFSLVNNEPGYSKIKEALESRTRA